MTERRTPLYDFHFRSARNLVKGGGDFMFPTSYTSPVEEHLNARRNVGMQDLSTMGEVDIKGPGAERLVRRLLVNEVQDMEPGQLRYSTMCNEEGGIVDDVTVYKFGDEHFMIVTSSGPRLKTYRWISEHAEGASAYATDVTAALALPVVQGPRSRTFLKTVVEGVDLDALRFSASLVSHRRVELIISRSGYTGSSVASCTPRRIRPASVEHLLEKGREFDLKPYGVEAMQSLRIEKSLPLYGPDISEEDTPFHVGLARWIRFEKRLYRARGAAADSGGGLDRRWVGLTLESEVPAAAGAKVYSVGDVATFREVIETGAEAGEYEDAVMPGSGRSDASPPAPWDTASARCSRWPTWRPPSWPGNNLIVEINGRPIPLGSPRPRSSTRRTPASVRAHGGRAAVRAHASPVATISSGSNVPARKYTNGGPGS